MKRRIPNGGKRVLALVSGLTMVAATSAAAQVTENASTGPAVPKAGVAAPAAAPALPEGITERIGGANRYETAALVAAEYPGPVGVVYIASGEVFPDALTARGTVAAAQKSADKDAGTDDRPSTQADGAGTAAPVLLTRESGLPQITLDALDELDPSEIRIVGGESRISEDQQIQLEEFAPVTRYAGDNRYETSAELATLFPKGLPTVFVATGETFPDAMVGGSVAGREGAPILLTDGDELSDSTAKALADLAPQAVVVFGGPNAVSDTAVTAITDIVPTTTRVAGTNRYETAAAISAAYEKDLDRAYLATGENYPDALTGSALAAYEGAPLLLTKATTPPATLTALDRLSPQSATLLGGPGAVSDANAVVLDAALPEWIDQLHLQLLSFNDYHGHLEVDSGATLTAEQDPDQNPVGGATYLSTTLEGLRAKSLPEQSMTVAAGDLIGGSPFLSGIFHDEPSVESLNVMELDVSSVGNHEFDEGTDELMRMQDGGCHPDDGCYFPDEPYAGADFPWLSANVVEKNGGDTLLPGTYTQDIRGVEVGFIGMTLEATPTLVSPGGVSTVDFLDEVETANASAAQLQADGVESIVVLLHEGGYQDGGYSECDGVSGPIVDIAEDLDPAIDMVVTGHTHQPYICDIPDPDGNSRLVTSANQYGRVVTESDVVLSQETSDVVRDDTTSANNLVLQNVTDPTMDALITKWKDKSDVVGAEVVGTLAEDITGSAGGDRGIETPLANLVADSILYGTEGPDQGDAEISFTNVGGVRADLLVDQITNGEQPGEVTYAEAFSVLPFGNILVSIDMTGADIKAVLEQQFDPTRGRQYLALGVSDGFTYTWDDTQPQGSKVSDMELGGVPLEDGTTYRVSTLNFLAEGGDSFTAFTDGTNLLGGPEDFKNLVDFMGANPGLVAPADRVAGL
ncbi:MAG: cell wall-binding repeat-containing protein [Ornithinimicrobium sp.]